MRNPSHLVNENCSVIYVNVGSSSIEPLSVDPNKTGLFGSSLSLNSRILVGDHPDHGFRFKASYREDPYRMLSEGEPYDYTNDLEYRTKVKNLISYHTKGPALAPSPEENDSIGYVWPSYIIWENDPSYTSFVGSPDRLELPKHVLRETRGHPRQDQISPQYYRPRLSDKWSF